jgi:hypothetical protein
MIDEIELSHAMRELAASYDVGVAPAEDVLRRGRRRRSQRRMAAALTSAVVATGAAVAVALGAVPAVQSAPARPGAAEPFHFRIDDTMTFESPFPRMAATLHLEGGYDPVRDAGYADFAQSGTPGPGGRLPNHLLQVNGVCFDGIDGPYPWDLERHRCIFDSLNTELPGAIADSPARLLDRIRATGTVTDTGRSGHTQSWTFRFPNRNVPPRYGPQYITGRLDVDVRTGHAIRLDVTRPIPQLPDYHVIGTDRMVTTYSEYGTPVVVNLPSNYTEAPSGAPS